VTERRHRYDYDVDPSGDSAPARVCRMVGKGRRVLEVGAGPGSLTRMLRAHGNHVTAVERDEAALPELRKHCEQLVVANLDDPAWPSLVAGQTFDAVVAADVLEHLVDPWSTVARMGSLVAEGGEVIASVPHAAHASVLASLLEEDLEYRDWGLLDRGHIRFFGMRNVQALFEGAGMKIVRADFVLRHPADTELKDRWNALSAPARVFLDAQRFGRVYQVIVAAARSDDPRPGIDLMRSAPGSHASFREAVRSFVGKR